MGKEIERKFLMRPFGVKPFLARHSLDYETIDITQFYLLYEKDQELRIRRANDRYFLTQKSAPGLVRREEEIEITGEMFAQMRPTNDASAIRKRRFGFRLQDQLFELDRFAEPLEGLVILEAEFPNKKEAQRFKLPKILEPFMIREVTGERTYSNGTIAQTMQIPAEECAKEGVIGDVTPLSANIEAVFHPLCRSKTVLGALFLRLTTVIAGNQQAILEGDEDPERLHQMRIAFRKLRTLLAEFSNLLESDWYAAAYAQATALVRETNTKRDLDVYFENVEKFRQMLPESMQPAIDEIETFLMGRKERAGNDLKTLFQSRDIADFIARFTEDPPIEERFNRFADLPIILMTYAVLQRHLKKIFRRAGALSPASPAQEFHRLRIQFKKIRYLGESFACVYPKGEMKTFIKSVKEMQTLLGNHQDLCVWQEHLLAYLKQIPEPRMETMLAIGKLIGDMQEREIEQRRLFMKRFEAFEKLSRSSSIFL